MERALRTVGKIHADTLLIPQLEANPDTLRFRHKNYEIPICDQEKDYPYIKIEASTIKLSDLERVPIEGLILRRAAVGKYLVLRTIEPAKKVNGITTVVEDHEGNVVVFCVYNFTEELNPDLGDILPVGTVFFLKEPYINKSINGDCFLRCDCPSDMIVVYEGHSLFNLTDGVTWKHDINPIDDFLVSPSRPSTTLEWVERGDFLLKSEKFQQAIRCYYQALQKPEELDPEGVSEDVVTLKLAEAFYNREFFEKALELSSTVLSRVPGDEGAILRAGRSCYKLRKFALAVEYFKKSRFGSVDVKEELKKAVDRVREAEWGEYNMLKHMMNRDSEARGLVDCANYVGPIVRFKSGAGSRGIITEQEVEAGTLLLVSKAYAFSWKPSINPVFGQFYQSGSWQHLLAQLAQKIAKNPATFSWAIHGLSACCGYNQYSPENPEHMYCDPDTKQEPIVDVKRLKFIVDEYAFCGGNKDSDINEDGAVNEYKKGGLLEEGCGVLPVASFFNHSCMPNAVAHSFGDALFVRANQYIWENEEVLLPYISREAPYEDKKSFLQSHKLKCYCDLCMIEARVPVNLSARVRRENLIAKYRAIRRDVCEDNSENSAHLIKRIRELMQEFSIAFGQKSCYITLRNSLLSLPQHLLSRAFALENSSGVSRQFGQQLDCYVQHLRLRRFIPEKLMESIGGKRLSYYLEGLNAVLDGTILESIVGIIKILSFREENVEVKKWIKILCDMEALYSGGDIAVVKYKYKGIERILLKHCAEPQ